MKRIEIPICPGDGVGPELIENVRFILPLLGKRIDHEFVEIACPAGSNCYQECGDPLPQKSLAIMREHPATLLTAISSKQCPPPSPMGQLRKELGIYADIRHCQSAPCHADEGVDIVIFRECSEDFLPDRNMYQGVGEFMPTPDVALSVRVTTRQKSAMISTDAFEYAEKNKYRHVTVANKSVVFKMGCGMFREEAEKQAALHPSIVFDEEAPDGLAGNIVMNPENYGVIIAASLFGDILSDVAAAKVGNIMRITNSNGQNALIYPSHGPQNKYLSTGKVSPLVIFNCMCDLFKWIGIQDAADILGNAVASASIELGLDKLILPDGITDRIVTNQVADHIRHA